MHAQRSTSKGKPVGQTSGGEAMSQALRTPKHGVTQALARRAQARFQKREA